MCKKLFTSFNVEMRHTGQKLRRKKQSEGTDVIQGGTPRIMFNPKEFNPDMEANTKAQGLISTSVQIIQMYEVEISCDSNLRK